MAEAPCHQCQGYSFPASHPIPLQLLHKKFLHNYSCEEVNGPQLCWGVHSDRSREQRFRGAWGDVIPHPTGGDGAAEFAG